MAFLLHCCMCGCGVFLCREDNSGNFAAHRKKDKCGIETFSLHTVCRDMKPQAGNGRKEDNMNINNMKAGCRFTATVKSVREAGVYTEMPENRGSGTISQFPRKPEFQPIPAGTMLLVDASNLLGVTGAEHAARILRGMSHALREQGYKPVLFIERRCLTWARCNQVSWDEEDELAEFAARADVVVVEDGGRKDGGEADCAMLQMAEVFEDSVCLTQDRFLDYANVHPSIVGTRRVRPFSVAMLEGRIIVLVSGLVRAIAIDVRDSGVLSVEKDEREITQPPVDMPAPAELPAEDKVLGHEAPEQVASEPEEVTAACVTEECAAENDAPAGSLEEAYVRKADLLLARGEGERAVRYLCRVAEKDYRAYYALAEHYAGKDVKLERKYLRLAAAAERRDRKTRLRYERRFAAAKRDGLKSGHLSRRTRAQVGMAKFASDHHAITGWLETHREFRRRPYGRVA